MGTGRPRQGQEARILPVANAEARAPKGRRKKEIELGHFYVLKMIEQLLYIMKASSNARGELSIDCVNLSSQIAPSPCSPFHFPSALPKSRTKSNVLSRVLGSSSLLEFHLP